MLSTLNTTLGRLWGSLIRPLTWLGGWLRPHLSALLGALVGVWQAPTWLRWLGQGLAGALSWARWHAVQVVVLGALGGLLWANSPVLKRWWQGLLPDRSEQIELTFKLTEPARTAVEDKLPPNPLVVEFSGQAAALVKVGKEASDIQMEPPAAGQWRWAEPTKLIFQPKDDWPVGQRYEVTLGKKALAAHVRLKERSFEFSAPTFQVTVASAEFYQDPVQVNLRRVVYQLRFSHPVDAASLEASLRLDEGDPDKPVLGLGQGAGRKHVVSYDALKLQATVMSEPLPIPAQTQSMRLTVAAGTLAQRGGVGLASELLHSVAVPGLYSLAVADVSTSVVSDDAGDPQHVLHVGTSMAVHERELARSVQAWLLPVSDKVGGEPFAWSDPAEITPAVLARATAIPLAAIASEREVSEAVSFRLPQAEGGRFLLVRVSKGLKSPGGYQLGSARQDVLQLKTFAPELTIMSRGSLLAASGDKKLPVLVRDLPGIQVEVARLLPQQLHMLVSQSEGEFSRPGFYRGVTPDHLAERFVRKIPLQLKPGRSHFETIDFAPYIKTEAGERRGVFLLSVQGYDPKADKPRANEDRSHGQVEGGDDGSGLDQRDDGDEGGNDGEGGGQAPDPSSLRDKRLVLVTDLGILAKRSVDGGRDVFVQSISSGEPVGQASVEVWGRNGLVLTTTVTDATGRARLPNLAGFQRERQPVMLVVHKEGDLSFLPFNRSDRTLDLSRFDVGGVVSAGVPNQMSAYLFSDRGIYRPGDTMHLGIIVKTGNWMASLRDLPVEVEVIDARGMAVRRELIKLGAAGAAEFSHTTSEASPTGSYTINLSLPRQSSPGAPEVPALLLGSTTVKVQEFLPDRTKVSAQFSSEVPEGWVRPDELSAKVSVQNLFGTPAPHRRVTGTLTLRPAYPAFRRFADYSFHDPDLKPSQQVDDLGEQQTDDQGAASFKLRLERFQAATYQAHVMLRAFEPEGGRSVAAEVQTLVSDQPYLVGVKTRGDLGYVARNARREVELLAVDPQVRPLAVPDLRLARLEHRTLSVLIKQSNGLYRYESRAKDVTLEELPLSLDARGGKVVLNTGTPGRFAYVVRRADGTVLNRIEYTVAGAANLSGSLERNAELQIKLNRKDYNPGDEIELSIQAPYTGAGLITIERDKVYAHAWFKADQTASVQRITLPKEFEGNGYVSVQFIRDPASDEIYTSPMSHGVAPFATSLARRTARIQLSSTPLVKPGQTMKMTLTAQAPTRAMVFAVDEGILQVARYQNPDPLQHFFKKRALEVSTLQTLDLILPEFKKLMQGAAPGGDGEGGLGKHLNPFKRKRDKPVAYWSGLIDVQGSKELSYTVPESFNGALRVIAVAVNDDTVAAASTSTTVRGDLVLLPNVPLAMSPGDTVEVGVGLANHIAGSGKGAAIDLSLSVGPGLEVVGEASRVLKINERDEGSTVFRIRARNDAGAQLGSASVVLLAKRGASQARLTTDVSVRPASAYVTLVQSGTLVGSGELPSKSRFYPQLARSELAVSATPWAFAAGLMPYLSDYPYGCTEQITSRVVPAMVMAGQPALQREAERGRNAAQVAALAPTRLWAGYLTQLRTRQGGDGGLALWPGSSPDLYATTYAVQVLVDARERKLPVPADLLGKASDYLQGQLGGGGGATASAFGWRTRAQGAYVLSRQGVLVPAVLANLRETLRSRPGQAGRYATDLGAAYLAASYQLLKQDQAARELIEPVWRDLIERMKTRTARQAWGNYLDPLVHDTALIYLVARHFPQLLPSLPTATWETLARLIGEGWYSSSSSASTILAVDAYAQAARQAAQGQLKAASQAVQGGPWLPLALPELNPLARAPVPVGSTKLRLAQGGTLPLFYAWSESGYERGLPDKASGQGMEVFHEVLNAQGQPITEAQLGEEVTVRVRIRSLEREQISQVALVDVLPGGLEPVQLALDESEQSDEPLWRRRLGGRGNWALDFVDVREDRVLFFGSVGRDMQEFSYRARATNTGQFAMPAAYAEAMYERRIFARSAAGQFVVKPVAR